MPDAIALVNLATFSLHKLSDRFNNLKDTQGNPEKSREVYAPPMDLKCTTIKTRIIGPRAGMLDLPLPVGSEILYFCFFCLGGATYVPELISGTRSNISVSNVLLIVSGIVPFLSFSRTYLPRVSPIDSIDTIVSSLSNFLPFSLHF